MTVIICFVSFIHRCGLNIIEEKNVGVAIESMDIWFMGLIKFFKIENVFSFNGFEPTVQAKLLKSPLPDKLRRAHQNLLRHCIIKSFYLYKNSRLMKISIILNFS